MSAIIWGIEKIKTAVYHLTTPDGVEKFRSEKQAGLRRDALHAALAAPAETPAPAAEAPVEVVAPETSVETPAPKAKKTAHAVRIGAGALLVKEGTVVGQLLGIIKAEAPDGGALDRETLLIKAVEALKAPNGAAVSRVYVNGYIAWALKSGVLLPEMY